MVKRFKKEKSIVQFIVYFLIYSCEYACQETGLKGFKNSNTEKYKPVVDFNI